MKKLVPVVLLCLGLICSADDIKTLDGQVYKDVTISRTEPDGIVITTDAGIEKIPFSSLSPDLQKKYGYDPAQARAYSAAVNAAQAENQARAAQERASQIAAQADAAKTAEDQNDPKKSVKKVVAKPNTGLIVRPDSMTPDQIAESPFSLRGYAVEVKGIENLEKHEVGEGIYEVEMRGKGAAEITAKMTAAQCDSAAAAKRLFVRVVEKESYSQYSVPVEALGSAVKHEGLDNSPTFYWY